MRPLLMGILLISAWPVAWAADQPAPWETWQPPAVTLPNPNGFDVYQKAFALKQKIDAENGIGRPGQAGGPVPVGPPRPAHKPPTEDGWFEGPPNLPLDQRVAVYAPVLKLVREALAMDCRIPPPNGMEPWPFFAQFRALARLLVMEAHARLEAGDAAGAAKSALDCMEMAQAAASQRIMIAFQVGRACEAMGTKALDEVILRLDADGCKGAMARMAQIEQRRVPMADVLAGEERLTRIMFKDFLARAAEVQGDPELRTIVEKMKTTTWGAMDEYWGSRQAQAAPPYGLRKALPRPTELFLGMIAQPYEPEWFKEAAQQADFNLREAQIAARGFLLEQGRLPESLQALVPAWLPSVPGDPFGDGPLKSKLTADALLIYSIGPDGKDDGGTPIKGNLRDDSVGDIVVTVPKG